MKRSLLACTLALSLAFCAQNTAQDVAKNTNQNTAKNTAQYATECSKTNIAPKKMSYKELITLIKDAKFYLLDGEFNGKKTKAYFIFSDETPSLFVLGVYRDSYKDLDLDTAKFGFENGLLTLEGTLDGVKFKFRQDASAKISEIFLVSNEFNVDKDFSSYYYSYYYSMLKIFIPKCNNNLSNEAYTKLNHSISLGAKSTDELKSEILSELKEEYASDASQQDETPHYQKDDEYVSIDLIDDHILLLHVNVNDSTNNGYNGVEDIKMMGYNLKTGNPIPSSFDDVFDKTKKRHLLDFLGKRLINDPSYSDWISPAAFPLTDEPEFYIMPGYVSFAWHIYDISIGTGGELTYLPIKFSDLKQFINPKSEYAYLFK
ncbi:hypothetical protein [Helicobacter bizzozeronii]|uniref:hypothetical protein n=1 Tax=Helicobacter bizzozeronii TaxID=56877 RepID=UPI000CEE58B9|nr:hypothetical protein [Helicobacter bizzozeronii]